MFKKILIANRGEIACRVIRTCHRLGIVTVAVYSDADVDALHVRMADEARHIGPSAPAESYLNIQAILQAARDCGAQAIHPGYGFLSENPRFARACADEGIKFIGPSPEAMQRMGDKVMARNLAREAGLPLVPGSQGDVSDDEALALAQEIGFPVMVKAAEGGGGIGIRVVEKGDDLKEAIRRSRSLAQNAFGSGRVYLERFLKKAAHVEVQILADEHGNVVHLGERDCSTQRRNQKVVEETPSPRLTPDLRHRMTQAAVALVRHIGYSNAGTVEFLVDDQNGFYFLEMNTRLQVEHPVTEMVTGLDLVEHQLRIAAGEPLSLRQEDIRSRGHAVEARIYSEDPDTLMPAVGTVQEVEEPRGPHVRVDTGIRPGYAVPPFYDPLLAKLVVWGEDRPDALRNLEEALEGFHIRGVKTNIPLVREVLRHPDFIQGEYYTGLLEQVLGQRTLRDGYDKELAAAVAVALATILRRRRAPQRPAANAWRMAGRRQQMMSRMMRGLRW